MSEQAELEYEEMCRQPYTNCVVSAGFVTGHPVDTLYLRLARDGEEPTTILLRPDEAAALAWCLTGALWSERMRLDGHAPPASATLDRIRRLARQIEQTTDSGKALEWSRDLRRLTVDLKQRVRRERAAHPAPDAADGGDNE